MILSLFLKNIKRTISFTVLFALLLLNVGAIGQATVTPRPGGPGGVGNKDGANSQPILQMWLDASTLALEYSNSNPIEVWGDLSGNANSATQATLANRPSFFTGQLNGRPAVSFDGSNDFLLLNGAMITNTDYSVLSIAKRRSTSTWKRNYIVGGDNSGANNNLHLFWLSNNYHSHHWDNDFNTEMVPDSETYSGGTVVGDYGVFASILNNDLTENPRRHYQNNHRLAVRDRSDRLNSWTGAAIARYGSSTYSDIDVAEMLMYSSGLNEAQLTIVNNYQKLKYGIAIAGHTFSPADPSYVVDMIGVGSSDGTQKHTQTANSGGGAFLRELNGSFDESNEYVFAAHANQAVGETTNDLPSLTEGALEGRSTRDWYIDRTAATTTSVSMGFDLAQVGLGAGNGNQIFYLLYRAGTSGSFSVVPGSGGVASGDMVWLAIDNANLQDGYYTIARSDQKGVTWYSYRSGNWDEWQTWTTESGGGDIVNAGELTPTTSPTAAFDKVVILDPYTVTVNTPGKANAILDVRDGKLDFGSTTGHFFNLIEGKGTIMLTADNFPNGNASSFIGVNGGTVEYHGTGHDLTINRTFNNVLVNLANTTSELVLLSNFALNGNLTVEKGVFKINNNISTGIINIDIAKDVIVNNSGKIGVGTGSTIGSFLIPSSMPALGQYHSIFHQVRIGGGMVNNGTVRFTNQGAPHYKEFTNNGAATVTFYGNSNNLAELYGTTDFYNLIIDKGFDRNFILEIRPDQSSHFQIYGPNSVGRRTGTGFPAENPEVRKALWIKNGTLKLTGSVVIPSLSEGSDAGGNGDYPIPANGRLWISGTDVKVFSTARDASAELLPETDGIKDNGDNQALSVYGEFKISNGFFSTRNSAGFVFWSEASAVVNIEGGLCDVGRFRSAGGGGGGKTSFIMSGGELVVRGSREFTWNLDYKSNHQINPGGGGGGSGDHPTFGIIDPEGVFQMSGGKIYIADESGNNPYGSSAVCIRAKETNHNVTGGTFYILMNNNDDYDIVSDGPLYNLEIQKLSGTGAATLYMGTDITLMGNLTIRSNTSLISRREHSSFTDPVRNLTVAQSFLTETTSNYLPYSNTTTLYVTNQAAATFNHGTQQFYNLVVKNNPFTPSTRRILEGNTNDITIHNNFTIETGAVLQHSDKNIVVKGNIYNSGKIELASPTTDAAKVVATDRGIVTSVTLNSAGNYTSIPTITIAGGGGSGATAIPVFSGVPAPGDALPLLAIEVTHSGSGYTSAPTVTIGGGGGATATAVISTQHEIGGDGNGVFANLEVDEVHPGTLSTEVTYLSARQTVTGTMSLTNGIFDLRTFNLDIEGTLSSNNVGDYSNSRMFRTAGNYSDGGLTRTITATGSHLFPIGTANFDNSAYRYAWANPEFTAVPSSGKVQINGVPSKLPSLTDEDGWLKSKYLQYYWRVRHSGFSNLPELTNRFIGYKYDIKPIFSKNWLDVLTGKVVGNKRTQTGSLIGAGSWPGNNSTAILEFSPTTVLETGEFTAGRAQVFAGTIHIYYTRSLDAREPRWNITSTWTRSDILDSSYSPHDSRQPAATDYPKVGDIAVIGWVPWDDPKTGLRGQPHGVWIDNDEEIAKLEFTQMTDNLGNPVERVYRSNFQFRPTLCINGRDGGNGELTSGWVEGEGNLWIRGGDPDLSLMDLGEFAKQDSAYIVYENFTDDRTYNNTPSVVPNIILANNNWGAYDHNVTLSENITTNGNFEILGNLNLVLSNGANGDINVGNDLVMFEITNPIEGSPSGGGAELAFQNSGTARTVNINGDLKLLNRGALIRVRNPNATGPLAHSINLFGNVTQTTGGGATPNGLQFYSGDNQDRILFNLLGDESKSYTYISGDIPTFYSIKLNKGASQATTFTFNNDFNLSGPTNGNTNTKALQLLNGTLVLNNTAIDINLSTGGEDFYIPSTSGLTVKDGTARVNATGANGILLDGRLAVGGGTEANLARVILEGGTDNYIEYSSSGNAEIRVLANAELEVGSQIRSSTQNSLGVLKFIQGGGNNRTIVGKVGSPTTSRGMFEVYNPGSRFQLNTGSLVIARPHSPAATRAALYLDAETVAVNRTGTVQIGDLATNPGGGIITINSKGDVPSIVVTSNATAKLEVNSLHVKGDVTINTDAAFDGSSLRLSLENDLTNSGTTNLTLDTLAFTGNTQIVNGSISANNILVNPISSVSIEGTTTVTALNDLHLNSGTLTHANQDVLVKGHVFNNANHTSTGTGSLLFNGTDVQHISGNGQFGRITIDNSDQEVRLLNSVSLNQDITLANGIFNLQNFRLDLNQSAFIQGTGFGPSKMVITDGGFDDLGIRKAVGTGAQNFLLPMGVISGVNAKYTPVEFDITANTLAGSVCIHSVNQAHLTKDCDDVLQYYWNVSSSGINGFEGTMSLHFDPNDVVGDANDYYRARLVGDSWSKDKPDILNNEIVNNNEIEFYYGGVNNLAGDYTAGTDACIPDNVPIYVSTQSGVWSDPANWRRESGGTVPAGGPQGHIVRILSGHTITMDRYRIRSYRTIITGRLEVGTETGHHLGFVSGTGTLALLDDKLYPGDYSAFLACGTGGTMEFGGSQSYTLPKIYNYNNLTITGSGTKTMTDHDVTICGNLRIEGNAILKHQPWESSAYCYTTIEGDVSLLDNATWNLNTRTWVILRGDFTKDNTASFNATYSYQTFYIEGSGDQAFTGNFAGSNWFNNLYFNNSNNIIFNGPASVRTFFYMYSGRVQTSSSSLFTVTRSGGNGLSTYVDGLFEGPVSINMKDPGTTKKFLPVGMNGVKKFIYPLDIPSSLGYWTGEYFNTSPTNAGMSHASMDDPPLKTISQSEYWRITGPNGVSSRIQLTLDGTSDIAAGIGDINNLRIVYWNGVQWQVAGGGATITGNASSGEVSTTASITFNGSEQYFTIGAVEEVVIPTANIDSDDQSICEGEVVSFTLALSGDSPWQIKYTDGTTESDWIDVPSSPYTITGLSPAATTTYELTQVRSVDQIPNPTSSVSGSVFGHGVTVTVYQTPTLYNVTGGGEICGSILGTIGLDGSQLGFTYRLYLVEEARYIQIVAGTGSAIEFTGLNELGTYEVHAHNSARPVCSAVMNGTASITLCVGVSAELTALVSNPSICEGQGVTLQITFSGTAPFTFSIANNHGQSWTNVVTDGTIQGAGPYTFEFTVPDAPVWVSPHLPNIYTYTLTSVTDGNSFVGNIQGAGIQVNVWKIPETGPQYHIPNSFGE